MLIRQFYQEQESIVYFVFDAQLRKKKTKDVHQKKNHGLKHNYGTQTVWTSSTGFLNCDLCIL